MCFINSNIDISFLEINGLVYNFSHIIKNKNDAVDYQIIHQLAANGLKLMDKYKTLHPQYQLLIDYIRKYDRNSKYNDDWVHEINQENKKIQNNSKHRYVEKTAFDAIKKGVISSVISGDYLHRFSQLKELTRFQTTQPMNVKQLNQNRYMEYFFLEFIINFYQLYWPISEGQEDNIQSSSFFNLNSSSISTDPLRSMQSIYKKVIFYYNKNESIFNEDNDERLPELFYYWEIKWLNVIILFKQLKFHECLKEIESMITNESEKNYALELLSTTPTLKSSILAIFTFSVILVKPFKDLTLIDTEFQSLVDSFVSVEDNIEFSLYTDILVPLSELNLRNIKTRFKDEQYISNLTNALGHIFPESIFKLSSGFLDYIVQMIDFKSFLLLLSITKQIRRSKLMKLLGYDENDDVRAVSNNLILLVSSLGLGETGIGYNVQGDFYYNNNEDQNKNILLSDEINELSEYLESETVAKLLKAVLIEKLIN